MISRVSGRLLARDLDRVEVMTSGGVAYEITIPSTVFEKLPLPGADVELRTYQVVREDGAFLYGFLEDTDRRVFGRLLTAPGVGPKLAIAMLSTLPVPRLIRAIRERDLPTLMGIPGVGRKTAERLALDLSSRLDDIPIVAESRPSGDGVEEALKALTVLGYTSVDAERAVRAVLGKNGSRASGDLIKAALAELR
jgi:Holliday junction DNA helicase RuvA